MVETPCARLAACEGGGGAITQSCGRVSEGRIQFNLVMGPPVGQGVWERGRARSVPIQACGPATPVSD